MGNSKPHPASWPQRWAQGRNHSTQGAVHPDQPLQTLTGGPECLVSKKEKPWPWMSRTRMEATSTTRRPCTKLMVVAPMMAQSRDYGPIARLAAAFGHELKVAGASIRAEGSRAIHFRSPLADPPQDGHGPPVAQPEVLCHAHGRGRLAHPAWGPSLRPQAGEVGFHRLPRLRESSHVEATNGDGGLGPRCKGRGQGVGTILGISLSLNRLPTLPPTSGLFAPQTPNWVLLGNPGHVL